jgi:hypothetical protein
VVNTTYAIKIQTFTTKSEFIFGSSISFADGETPASTSTSWFGRKRSNSDAAKYSCRF